MSYQDYPPPGYGSVYPPPQQHHQYPAQYSGHPYQDPSAGGYSYPPPPPPSNNYQGYFNPPPPQNLPPYQVYHCEHEDQDDCSSFLKGCLAALCFCCVLDECFG